MNFCSDLNRIIAMAFSLYNFCTFVILFQSFSPSPTYMCKLIWQPVIVFHKWKKKKKMKNSNWVDIKQTQWVLQLFCHVWHTNYIYNQCCSQYFEKWIETLCTLFKYLAQFCLNLFPQNFSKTVNNFLLWSHKYHQTEM